MGPRLTSGWISLEKESGKTIFPPSLSSSAGCHLVGCQDTWPESNWNWWVTLTLLHWQQWKLVLNWANRSSWRSCWNSRRLMIVRVMAMAMVISLQLIETWVFPPGRNSLTGPWRFVGDSSRVFPFNWRNICVEKYGKLLISHAVKDQNWHIVLLKIHTHTRTHPAQSC